MGRWKALRPKISPMPPARLLMTAVRTASPRSIPVTAPVIAHRRADIRGQLR